MSRHCRLPFRAGAPSPGKHNHSLGAEGKHVWLFRVPLHYVQEDMCLERKVCLASVFRESSRGAFFKRAASDCQKTPGELERAAAFRTFNRAQRRVRWARGDFCVGKSHFPEQKSFPCSFCARKSLRFQQKLVRVAERLKTLWVFRFRLWRNCRRLKS